jgi:ketol-acid reductoisomerase
MIICGGVPALIVETFNMLKKRGVSEKIALQECLYELSYMLSVLSDKRSKYSDSMDKAKNRKVKK